MIYTNQKKLSISLGYIYIDSYNHDICESIEVVVCSRKFADYLSKYNLPNLKLIQLTSAGYDGIDLDLYRKRGVWICNMSDTYSVAISEFVVYCFLKSAKRYNRSISNMFIRFFRNYKYITELSGKTVTILGVGSIAKHIAKRLSAFEMELYGYGTYDRELPYFNKIYSSKEDLKLILQRSDYIVSTLPLNDNTYNLLDKDLFLSFRNDCVFMNVGRNSTINQDDLWDLLKKNKRMTAFLDMFDIFPNPITNRFYRLSNVVVIPGVVAISREVDLKKNQFIRNNISLFKNSLKPKCICNE